MGLGAAMVVGVGWEARGWVAVKVMGVGRALVVGWEARGWVGVTVLGGKEEGMGWVEVAKGKGWEGERALVVGRGMAVAAAMLG